MGKASRLKREKKAVQGTPRPMQQAELWLLAQQARQLFASLTTPTNLTESVREFCRSLSDRAPFFIACEPEPWSRLGCCDQNVAEYIRHVQRGESVFGYRIWTAGYAYVEAESHVIWRAGDACRDVSFSADGEDQILFLPVSSDFVGTFDEVPKKIRRALVKQDVAALRAFEEYEARFVNRIVMAPDEAWNKMLTFEQWQRGERQSPLPVLHYA